MVDIKPEIWLRSISFPLYEVSSAGRIRRLAKRGRMAGRMHIMNPRFHDGYHCCELSKEIGIASSVRIHRLVCEAFHGPAPSPRHQAAHRDGNRINNVPNNLYWATPLENAADTARHGTLVRGSKHSHSKLTEDAVLDIKIRHRQGLSGAAIARKYGVSENAIWRIIHGITWAHVTLDEGNPGW